MDREEVRKYLTKKLMKRFDEWMAGQTVGFKDGEVDYYDHDVKRFADAVLYNKITYFD